VSADLFFESRGESDTSRLGAILAGVLQPGLTLSLNGQLGAGKTFFVRALAVGLGVNELHVSSPTFVVLQQYVDGRIPLAHFDVYRLHFPHWRNSAVVSFPIDRTGIGECAGWIAAGFGGGLSGPFCGR